MNILDKVQHKLGRKVTMREALTSVGRDMLMEDVYKQVGVEFSQYVKSLPLAKGVVTSVRAVPVLVLEVKVNDGRLADSMTQMIREFGDQAPCMTLPSVIVPNPEKAE